MVIVDPNDIHYDEAIDIIEEDHTQNLEAIVPLVNVETAIEEIIRYLRSTYSIVHRAGVIRVLQAPRTTGVRRYKVYFYKETPQNAASPYEIYKAVVDFSSETPENRIKVIEFGLYAHSRQVSSDSSISDLGLDDDTDIAYGYKTINIEDLSQNVDTQYVLKYIDSRYKDVVADKKVKKIEELRLFDGRVNYKIYFQDVNTGAEFKFVVFYQPALQKVMVLNSVNLPTHSQYNQLSSEEQKSDNLLIQVINYINSLHPELMGFGVNSVSKSIGSDGAIEYHLVIEHSNLKYKSMVRVSANNIDMKEINFSEMVEISLDHYKLDQFDEMFIMNFEKLS